MLADHEDDPVGHFGRGDGGGHTGDVIGARIRACHIVDRHTVRRPVTQTVEQRDDILGPAPRTPRPELGGGIGRQGTDHRDPAGAGATGRAPFSFLRSTMLRAAIRRASARLSGVSRVCASRAAS